MNPTKSVTNFDLPSLHILLEEIDVALKDAEVHLSEFYDDEEQAKLLLESSEVIRQLSAIFGLLNFKGSSALALALADCFQKLYDSGDNTNTALVMDISEGIMVLDRYIEFVLLKEVLEPALLESIINKLHHHLGKPPVSIDDLARGNAISIRNPQSHYQNLAELNLDLPTLVKHYRAGLGVILAAKDGQLSAEEVAKVQGLSLATQTIAQHSDALFWQAAAFATKDIVNRLPLANDSKRVLIYLEQQLQYYLPLEDRRFADLVSLAFAKDENFAKTARQKYELSQAAKSEQMQMQRFLFGPNREITDTLNFLIQGEIAQIKEKVDNLARQEAGLNTVTNSDIATQIAALASAMHLIGLDEASKALRQAANSVNAWQNPTADDFDTLLLELMVAENAAIFLTKSHTPGAVKLPLHNRQISLHQLDTAYSTLIKESRSNIAMVTSAIESYVNDPNKDVLHVSNIPEILNQTAGSVNFLNLPKTATMIDRLARYLAEIGEQHQELLADEKLALVADVLMAVDLHLEGQENNRPVSKHSLLTGQRSLNRLTA